MRHSRKKSKKSRRRRRRNRRRTHKGGACGCPLVNNSSPLPPTPWEPPGGMYQPGAVNGLDGGYYYGVNVDQSLPDPISSSAIFGQKGGRRRRHARKHKKRRTKRRGKRRRRRTRRRRRRRRRQRGGGWFSSRFGTWTPQKLVTTILPKDLLDVGYKAGRSASNLYRGYVGARPKVSTAVMSQPINKDVQILSPPAMDPIKSSQSATDNINAATKIAQQKYMATQPTTQ